MKGVLDKGNTSPTPPFPRQILTPNTVNRDLKQHSRKVYSRQMIEHVVEQIDTLYWESGASPIDLDEEDEEEETHTAAAEATNANALTQTDDLTRDENIAKLPATWHQQHDANITQDDYLSSVSRLQDLSAQRQMLQNRLTTYRTLLTLLHPYRAPKENIQPNLVSRDAPLAPELAKTRTLAIRVAARVEDKFGDVQVPATAEEEEDDVDMGMDTFRSQGQRKVDKVLASW
jgi:hypothetical protein